MDGDTSAVSNRDCPTRFRHPPWWALLAALGVAVVGLGLQILVFDEGPWWLVLPIFAPVILGHVVWHWRGASVPDIHADDDSS